MSEHTEGPWRVGKSLDIFDTGTGAGVWTEHLYVPLTKDGRPYKNRKPESEYIASVWASEDAPLIAAAPTLLSALRTLLAELNGERPSLLDALDAARNAIAKAGPDRSHDQGVE
jgi:hypothetical protein